MQNVDIRCFISWCCSLGRLWDVRGPALDSLQMRVTEEDESGSLADACIFLDGTSVTQERTYEPLLPLAYLFNSQPHLLLLLYDAKSPFWSCKKMVHNFT